MFICCFLFLNVIWYLLIWILLIYLIFGTMKTNEHTYWFTFALKRPCWSLERMQPLIWYILYFIYSTVWIFFSPSSWRFGYLGLCCPSFDQYKPLAAARFMVEHLFKARYLKLNRYVISESQGQLRPGLCYWQEETFTVLLVRLLNSLHFRAGCPGRRNCQVAKRAILKRFWSPRFTTWGLPPWGSGEGTLQRTS